MSKWGQYEGGKYEGGKKTKGQVWVEKKKEPSQQVAQLFSYLETLPFEVYPNILKNVDCSELTHFCTVSPKFNLFCQQYRAVLLEGSLGRKTGFDLQHFTLSELDHLCQVVSFGGQKILITLFFTAIIRNGKLYANLNVDQNKYKRVLKSDETFYSGEIDRLFKQVKTLKVISVTNKQPVKSVSSNDVDLLAVIDQKDQLRVLGIDPDKLFGQYVHLLEVQRKSVNKVSVGLGEPFSVITLDSEGLVHFIDTMAQKAQNQLQELFNQGVRFKDIVAGYEESVLLSTSGQLYQCQYVQEAVDSIALWPLSEVFVKVKMGYSGGCAITNQGKVYSWGINQNQLGFKSEQKVFTTPTLIPTLDKIIDVACAGATTLFLMANGDVYASGHNMLSLFDPTIKEYKTDVNTTPQKIQGIDQVVQISVYSNLDNDEYAYLFLDVNNDVYLCGHGDEITEIKQADNTEGHVLTPTLITLPD